MEKKDRNGRDKVFFSLIFFIDFRHHVIRKPGLPPFPFPTKGKHCVAVALPPVGRPLLALRRRIKITGIFKASCGIPAQAERAWSAAELRQPRPQPRADARTHAPERCAAYDATADVCLAAAALEQTPGRLRRGGVGEGGILKRKKKGRTGRLFFLLTHNMFLAPQVFRKTPATVLCICCACCRGKVIHRECETSLFRLSVRFSQFQLQATGFAEASIKKLHSAPRGEAGAAPRSFTGSLGFFLQITSLAEYNVHLVC